MSKRPSHSTGFGAANLTVDVLGIPELLDALRKLKDATQRKYMRTGVEKAMRVLRSAARSLAPRESGLLAKSMSYVIRTYPQKNLVLGVAGPAWGFKSPVQKNRRNKLQIVSKKKRALLSEAELDSMAYRDPAKYGHLLEGGHELVRSRKGIKRTIGHVAARPFLKPAYRAVEHQMLSLVAYELENGLTKEAERARAASGRKVAR